MKIETNMPENFAVELKALFDRYGIITANGWDDGSLILYLDNRIKPPHGGPHFWVEFNDEDGE